jgi:stage III sporulation protein SpoIIIAA
VIIVDTSNEIGGDGDIRASWNRRKSKDASSAADLQHAVMIEAVENHMPEVIVIDEIGTEAEAPGRPDDRRARRSADRHRSRKIPWTIC